MHKVQALSQLESQEDIIWIDLQNPTPAEISDVEAHFEFKFQSRQQQLEIDQRGQAMTDAVMRLEKLKAMSANNKRL